MAKDWRAVADAINARMAERGMTQKDLAAASRVSVATLRKLQKAEPGERGAPVLAAVAVALHWPPDYLEALASGDASPEEDPLATLRGEVAAVRDELAAMRDRIARLETCRRDDQT